MKIFISGDFVPCLRVKDVIEKGEYESLFNDILPLIQEADYAITNLESPLADDSSPICKTGPNLIAPTKSVEVLSFAGFDMVTLANNHTMDQGVNGLISTLSVLEKNNISHVGAGLNYDEAKSVSYTEIKNKRVAFVNFCENEWSTTKGKEPGCNPLDEVSLFYQLIEARSSADFVIVIAHGGHEMYELPSPRMKKLYRWFIDIGADAVIGHHTHCYCGRETYQGKPIVYSLGNFIFDNSKLRNGLWTNGCACMLSLDDNYIDVRMFPFHQCDQRVGITLYNEKESGEFNLMDELKQLIIADDDQLNAEFNKFARGMRSRVINMFEPSMCKYYQYALSEGLIPHFVSKSHLMFILDSIRCEAHRDVIIESLV